MKWNTPYLPCLHNWGLALLLLLVGFACTNSSSPKDQLDQKLHHYLSRMGVEEPVSGVFTFVPSYGCKWCRTMVADHAESMLRPASHVIIVADELEGLPEHSRLWRDTTGLLDRSGLARGVITRYYIESNQLIKIDTLDVNYFSRWLSSYLP